MAEPVSKGAGLCLKVLEGGQMVQQEGSTQSDGRLDSWLAVLDRHRVQYLILNKERDAELLSLVRVRSGWAVDFEDEASVLFSRSLAEAS